MEDPQTILRNTPSGLDALFSSDKSDSAQLADRLGITHVIIDPYRKEVPVTSADIRIDPMAHWEHIPQEVRPFFIRRVALVGPESCGKSFLSEQLAVHFQTVFVEEYGRTYCERFGMDLSELDFAQIAGGQLYREDEMARQANRILFCDTDLIVTQVWSEVYFKGRCQPWIIGADHGRQYDLYLLLAPDIPWINDGLREYEGRREWMFRLRVEMERSQSALQDHSGRLETTYPAGHRIRTNPAQPMTINWIFLFFSSFPPCSLRNPLCYLPGGQQRAGFQSDQHGHHGDFKLHYADLTYQSGLYIPCKAQSDLERLSNLLGRRNDFRSRRTFRDGFFWKKGN